MKKIIGLLFVFLFFVGCDDGDLVVESISLDEVSPVKCNINNILYKFNDNQSMVLEMSDIATAFKNEESTKLPITIDNTANKLVFRTYNGEVKATNICATNFDAFPNVNDEWIAQSGLVSVVTKAQKSAPDATTNATRISGYNHSIVLKNIEWLKPDGSRQLETIDRPFGVYQTTPTNALPFGFQDNPLVFESTCLTDKTIIAKSGRESMRLKLDDTSYNFLFTNATTLPNNPKIKPLTATNTVVYNLFNGLINVSDFCLPLPAQLEQWTAIIQTGTTTATIEVETTTETTTRVKHTIYLKGVTFTNGNVSFYYGDRIKFGLFLKDI
jgi:hypothetical protein